MATSEKGLPDPRRKEFGKPLYLHCRVHPILEVAISDNVVWLIAIGLIAVDLLFFVVPIVPFVAAYILIVRPPWFKSFVDDLYGHG